MGHRADLKVPKKPTIIPGFVNGKTTLQYLILGRNQRTVKKLVAPPDAFHTRADRGSLRTV